MKKRVMVSAVAALLLVMAAGAQSYGRHRLTAVDPAVAQQQAQSSEGRGASPRSRPDLACKRLRQPGDGNIYLVNPEGNRQWIPNTYTYNLLFHDWTGIYDDPDLNEIPRTADLENGSTTLQANGQDKVYFVSNGQKRWITDPETMDRCNFRWPARGGVTAPPAVVEAIPTGMNWTVR